MVWLPIFVFATIIILGVITYYASKHERELFKKTGKHPVGYYKNKGIGIGLALGVAFGIPFGNIAFGLPIGLVLGMVIGERWEKEHAKELRPLTKKELKRQRRGMIASLVIGVVLFIAVLMTYFLVK